MEFRDIVMPSALMKYDDGNKRYCDPFHVDGNTIYCDGFDEDGSKRYCDYFGIDVKKMMEK